MTDYLDVDPAIEGQNYACLSFCFPERVRNCKIRGIKCRGVYEDEQQARARCEKLAKHDTNFPILIGAVGKWLPYNPIGPFNPENDLVALTEMVKRHKAYIDNAEVGHEKRKQNVISTTKENITAEDVKAKPQEDEQSIDGNTDTEDFNLEHLNQESGVSPFGEALNKPKMNEVELEDDSKLSRQKYYCLSVCSPAGLLNTSVFGIKIRGVYASEKLALERCKELADIDKYFDIFVAEVGKWHDCNADVNHCEQVIYRDEKLNEIIKTQTQVNKKNVPYNTPKTDSLRKKLKKTSLKDNIDKIKQLIEKKKQS